MIALLFGGLILLKVSHSILLQIKTMLLVSIHRFILVSIVIFELVQFQTCFYVTMQHSDFIVLDVFNDFLGL